MTLDSNKLVSQFEIKYGDLLKLILLKRAVYLSILFAFLLGEIIFIILLRVGVIDIPFSDIYILHIVDGILGGIAVIAFGLGTFKGYKTFWGKSEAYKNDDGTMTFIGQGKHEQKIVTLRVNEIQEYHGFYCLKENYFNFVLVPHDFPIEKIPVSSIKKEKKH